VRAQFIAASVGVLRNQLQAAVAQGCLNPLEPTDGPSPGLLRLRADLRDVLGEAPTGEKDNVTRQLRLCRIAALDAKHALPRMREAAALAEAAGPPESWSPEQARWLGQAVLDRFDPMRDPATWQALGAEWLGSGLARLPGDHVAGYFEERLLKRCAEPPGGRTWCWQAAQQVARRVTADPWVALELSINLVDMPAMPGVDAVPQWLDEAERRLHKARLEPAQRQYALNWLRLARLRQRFAEVQPGDAPAVAALERDLAALEEADTQQQIGEQVDDLRVRVALEKQDNPKAAHELARKALSSHADSVSLQSQLLFAALRQGDRDAARDALARIEASIGPPGATEDARQSEPLLLAALGHLMLGDSEFERARRYLRTGHVYVNLVAMLMHHRMVGSDAARDEADLMIQTRWRAARRESWPQRLLAGDGNVWYEILLGVYLGQEKPERVLAPLQNVARFSASEFARLPYDLAGLRADAYFYEALRHRRDGNRAEERRYLQRVVEEGRRDYFEYSMARLLLAER
jgi:hypothetical protein